ncbi:MAG: sigma-70 family RNA polymerase sigma factor, partial [Betaproteobacteria bacterium]
MRAGAAGAEPTTPAGPDGGDVYRCERRAGTAVAPDGPRRDRPRPGLHRRPPEGRWHVVSPVTGEPRWQAAELGREALAYADTLHNLARYLTRNATDAEDLVQETYTRALRAAAQFTPGTNLKAWLFRILRNTFISLYRRQRRDPTVGGLDTVNPSQHDATDGGWLRGDLELEHLRTVVGEEIERALMSLSEEARTVVLLDLEGLSEHEVANV